MWSYYDWVVGVVFRQLTQYVVVLSLGCYLIIIRPHIVFTDGRPQRQPNHNITTYCVNRRKTTTLSVNTICGRIMIELSLLSFVSKHNTVEFVYNEQVYHIVFTDGRQQQPNHNTTTYCVY
jgi:hypothetical protein